MFWHLVVVLLSPLSALCVGLLHDDRDREILALRQQVLILQRRLAKRPQLTRRERLALLLTFWRMKQRQLLASLMIVQPATLANWHRQIVPRHWTFGAKRRPGRPRIDPQAEQLVLRLARDNSYWGYTKLVGEVRKLGFTGIGRSTVARILKRHGFFPPPHRRGLSWDDLLGH